jgi:hypothetical protein
LTKELCISVGHFHGAGLKNFALFGQCVAQVKIKDESWGAPSKICQSSKLI